MAFSLLFEELSNTYPSLFCKAMSSTVRIRDWIFSSVASNSVPPVTGFKVSMIAVYASLMGNTLYSIPRFSARRLASSTDSSDENCDGIINPLTFSAPSAPTARQATTEESIPPDRPTPAFS